MTSPVPKRFGDADPRERWQRRLQVIAWLATLLPILAFAFLTWQSIDLARENEARRMEIAKQGDVKAQLESEIAELTKQKETLSQEKEHYRSLADVKVVYYRRQNTPLVESALKGLGLNLELREGIRTIDKEADTLAYGPEVSQADCKAVATALIRAGFPIRRIAPAQTVREARLLQIYASGRTDPNAPLYTPERIERADVCSSAAR